MPPTPHILYPWPACRTILSDVVEQLGAQEDSRRVVRWTLKIANTYCRDLSDSHDISKHTPEPSVTDLRKRLGSALKNLHELSSFMERDLPALRIVISQYDIPHGSPNAPHNTFDDRYPLLNDANIDDLAWRAGGFLKLLDWLTAALDGLNGIKFHQTTRNALELDKGNAHRLFALRCGALFCFFNPQGISSSDQGPYRIFTESVYNIARGSELSPAGLLTATRDVGKALKSRICSDRKFVKHLRWTTAVYPPFHGIENDPGLRKACLKTKDQMSINMRKAGWWNFRNDASS